MVSSDYREQEVQYVIGTKSGYRDWLDTWGVAREDIRVSSPSLKQWKFSYYPLIWVREWELALDLTGNIDSELL